MKYKRYTALFIAVLLLFTMLVPVFAEDGDLPELTAQGAICVHRDSGTVVYEKNADKRAYPASLTKIMTALIAIEAIEAGRFDTADIVTASDTFQAGLAADGSTQNIQPGEEMTLGDLLYCVLMASANEACNIVAEYTYGSVDAFVAKMNERAADLGCTGTNFVNAHGLHDENHYTTARDIYTISAEALDHQLFVQITSTAMYTVPATNLSEERSLTNTNQLISNKVGSPYKYEYAIGGKTGSTSAAGYCLMSHAEKNGLEYIAVVMGCQEEILDTGAYGATSFSDSIALYNWAFTNYSLQSIASASDMIQEVPVKGAQDADYVVVHPATNVTLLLPNAMDMEQIERKVTLFSEELEAPVVKGSVLGTVAFVYKGQTIAETDLLALTSLNAKKGIFNTSTKAGSTVKTMVTIIVIAALLLLFIYLALVISYNVRRRRHRRRKKVSSRHRDE